MTVKMCLVHRSCTLLNVCMLVVAVGSPLVVVASVQYLLSVHTMCPNHLSLGMRYMFDKSLHFQDFRSRI